MGFPLLQISTIVDKIEMIEVGTVGRVAVTPPETKVEHSTLACDQLLIEST